MWLVLASQRPQQSWRPHTRPPRRVGTGRWSGNRCVCLSCTHVHVPAACQAGPHSGPTRVATMCVLGIRACACRLGHFSRVRLSAVLWTVAHQAPLSTGLSSREDSGLPRPPPGDLPHTGTAPASLASPALAGGVSTSSATWRACACVCEHVCVWSCAYMSRLPHRGVCVCSVQGLCILVCVSTCACACERVSRPCVPPPALSLPPHTFLPLPDLQMSRHICGAAP